MAGPTRRPLYKDAGFVFICVLSFGAALGVYLRDGWARFQQILWDDAVLWLTILPKVAAGVTVAAFLRLLLPREVVARWIGERSGLK
ncbi:MAG: hypothetical protein KI785_13700, partial [Devosiaceae bacterium]|nr:hypothetical protein [Devosiaceae bacterium MH13]